MSSVKFKYESGIEVKDMVTGLSGIINGRMECLNGCIRYSVQPKADEKDPHKMPDGWWIDEAQIEVISQGLRAKPKKSRTGGPMERSTIGSKKAPRF